MSDLEPVKKQKLPDAQVRAREAQIWTWILEERTTTWIADKLGIAAPGVSRIKRRVMERMDREVLEPAVRSVRAKQIAKARRVQSESWDAWERSKKSKVRAKKKTTPVVSGQPNHANATIEVNESTVEQRDGNPAYLDRYMAAVEMESRLTGAAMPIKIAPTNPDGTEAFTLETPTERRSRIQELIALAQARRLEAQNTIDVTPIHEDDTHAQA